MDTNTLDQWNTKFGNVDRYANPRDAHDSVALLGNYLLDDSLLQKWVNDELVLETFSHQSWSLALNRRTTCDLWELVAAAQMESFVNVMGKLKCQLTSMVRCECKGMSMWVHSVFVSITTIRTRGVARTM